MSEIFVDSGLDRILGIYPKNGANDATLFMGLFTSQTPTTVPARGATGGAVPSGWTEVSGLGYARQAVVAASWGAAATNGSGRKITAGQVTFPTALGDWTQANGFFLATLVASGALDVIIFFANFDDGNAVTLHLGDVLKCTASIQYDG